MPAVDPLLQHIADNETESLEWLTRAGNQISLESADKPFVSDPGFFRKFIDKIGNYFSGFSFRVFEGKRIAPSPVDKLLADSSYQITRNFVVDVPPGFKGNVVEYLKLVQSCTGAVMNTGFNLRQTIKTLAVLINEPDRMAAQTGIVALSKQMNLINNDQFEDLKSYFQTGNKAVAKFSDCYDNNAEFVEAIKLCNAITEKLSDSDLNFTEIKNNVARISELAKQLNASLTADTDVAVSGQVAKQLSDLFYQLGVSVTAVSVITETMAQMTKSVGSTTEALVVSLQTA